MDHVAPTGGSLEPNYSTNEPDLGVICLTQPFFGLDDSLRKVLL